MKRDFQRAGILILIIGGAVLLAVVWAAVSRGLAYFFGFSNGSGDNSHYLFWSGAGSDLAYLSFLWGAVVLYRRHNCQMQRCWRVGHHDFTDPVDGVTRKLCWKHHPDVRHKNLTPQSIQGIQERRLRELQKRWHLYVGDHPGDG